MKKEVSTLITTLKKMRDDEGRLRVTPSVAEKILRLLNLDNYRKWGPAVVNTYARYLEEGLFVAQPSDHLVIQLGKFIIPQGDHKGETIAALLQNGQNRLMAVVKTGIAGDFYLTFCDVETGQAAMPWADWGSNRTPAQYLARECGIPLNVAQQAAMITRLMCVHEVYAGKRPRNGNKYSSTDIYEKFKSSKNSKAVLQAVEITRGTTIRKGATKMLGLNAAYKTALAKGLRIFPKKRMLEFHTQYCLGTCNNPKTDQSAQLLSKYYAENFLSHRGGGELPTHEYYLRCEWAIRAFGDREEVTQIGAAKNAGDYLPL